MANPVCLSPLKFYDDAAKQCHRKSYAHGNISPLIVKQRTLPPFQFVIPSDLYLTGGILTNATLYDAKTDRVVIDNFVTALNETGFAIRQYSDFYVAMYTAQLPVLEDVKEGYYYIKLSSASDVWAYYSEVFSIMANISDCLELEYWNSVGNFSIKNGIVAFPSDFHFKLLLKTEIGKPEYNFEEESTKRLGYSYIESQVSKKTYKFNALAPEFICDAMRIIRLCDNKLIKSDGDEYEAITFDMEVEWQTQGDIASINCEFETDNVMVNLGGFMPDTPSSGSFNNDFNNDFDN